MEYSQAEMNRYIERYNLIVAWIAYQIATFEGYFKPGSLAERNNNPGNLRNWGNRPTRNGFAYFDNINDGVSALYRQIHLNIQRDLTFREFFAGKPGVYPGYAPAADKNNPNQYAAYVANIFGWPIDLVSILSLINNYD